jgi:hypothetical protein
MWELGEVPTSAAGAFEPRATSDWEIEVFESACDLATDVASPKSTGDVYIRVPPVILMTQSAKYSARFVG